MLLTAVHINDNEVTNDSVILHVFIVIIVICENLHFTR